LLSRKKEQEDISLKFNYKKETRRILRDSCFLKVYGNVGIFHLSTEKKHKMYMLVQAVALLQSSLTYRETAVWDACGPAWRLPR
jgi:hypothetical protein